MSIEFSNFDGLLTAAHGLSPMPVVVVDAGERHVLEGACEAAEAGFIDPILVGNKVRIRAILTEIRNGVEFPIIHAVLDEEAAEKGVELIETGKARALMKGHIHTAEFLHPIFAHLRGKKRVSHVFLADLPKYPKLLYITDAAINITPDLTTKAEIVKNAIDLVRLLGVESPMVAALSAIETINPAIPSTIDAACLAKMADRGQISGAVIDGPLAFDNAISSESAKIKGIKSNVAGKVDILLVPDLVSGNILAKDLEYLAGAQIGGIVMGTHVPIILTSRADSPQARLISCAVAALINHRQEVDQVKK